VLVASPCLNDNKARKLFTLRTKPLSGDTVLEPGENKARRAMGIHGANGERQVRVKPAWFGFPDRSARDSRFENASRNVLIHDFQWILYLVPFSRRSLLRLSPAFNAHYPQSQV